MFNTLKKNSFKQTTLWLWLKCFPHSFKFLMLLKFPGFWKSRQCSLFSLNGHETLHNFVWICLWWLEVVNLKKSTMKTLQMLQRISRHTWFLDHSPHHTSKHNTWSQISQLQLFTQFSTENNIHELLFSISQPSVEWMAIERHVVFERYLCILHINSHHITVCQSSWMESTVLIFDMLDEPCETFKYIVKWVFLILKILTVFVKCARPLVELSKVYRNNSEMHLYFELLLYSEYIRVIWIR